MGKQIVPVSSKAEAHGHTMKTNESTVVSAEKTTIKKTLKLILEVK